jgi:hypothetical protein
MGLLFEEMNLSLLLFKIILMTYNTNYFSSKKTFLYQNDRLPILLIIIVLMSIVVLIECVHVKTY